jgi:hypothetical protein
MGAPKGAADASKTVYARPGVQRAPSEANAPELSHADRDENVGKRASLGTSGSRRTKRFGANSLSAG